MPVNGKPKIAVFKFASCDGCQLSLLDLEDELLGLCAEVQIAYFLEARTYQEKGPYDVALVEGSITTQHDIERIHQVRQDARYLVTIGACATTGGIQALRNWEDIAEFIRIVYATPAYIETLATSTSISSHVAVDFELNGCPVNRYQLLEILTALLLGRPPQLPAHSVCVECKRAGTNCVLVSHGIACMGPLTHAGCGALCPAYNRGCYGCFGPMESPNTDALVAHLRSAGIPAAALKHLLRTFTGYAETFRSASDKLERGEL
jgi:sulfhydrogenase subunit delta